MVERIVTVLIDIWPWSATALLNLQLLGNSPWHLFL